MYQRLANYAADRSLDYSATLVPTSSPSARWRDAAVHYRPVETDGAARARALLDNRGRTG